MQGVVVIFVLIYLFVTDKTWLLCDNFIFRHLWTHRLETQQPDTEERTRYRLYSDSLLSIQTYSLPSSSIPVSVIMPRIKSSLSSTTLPSFNVLVSVIVPKTLIAYQGCSRSRTNLFNYAVNIFYFVKKACPFFRSESSSWTWPLICAKLRLDLGQFELI